MERKTVKMPTNTLGVKEQESKIKKSAFPLTKTNFILMGVCGLMIVVGFLLMLGGSNDAAQFNDDIFSTRRVIIGPTIAFIGFVAMAFAIIYKGKKGE